MPEVYCLSKVVLSIIKYRGSLSVKNVLTVVE